MWRLQHPETSPPLGVPIRSCAQITWLLLLGLGSPLTAQSYHPGPEGEGNRFSRLRSPNHLPTPTSGPPFLIADARAPVLVAGTRLRVPGSPFPVERTHRARNALIGGLIGSAAGIVTCTVISNIAKDPGTGFSTCTRKGYFIMGLGGAGVGALIGALFK